MGETFPRLLWLAFFTMVSAAADLSIGNVTAHPGQKASGVLHVAAGVDEGTEVPLIVIHGSKPGPVLSLISGTHGAEYGSIVALPKLAQHIDPTALTGSVVILPLVNVASFLDKVPHRNPVDRRGMNNYPGKPDGSQSERVSSAIYEQVVKKSDYLIDYHGGDLDENLRPFAYWTKADKEPIDTVTRDMLLAFGLDMIVTKGANGRALDSTAISMGKPCITVLGGHAGTASEYDVDVLIRGTLDVMRHLKMLPGTVHPVEHPLWLSHYSVLKADHDGLFFPLVVPESYVEKGTKVGYITDYFGARISEVTAPVSGVVIYIASVPSAKTGDNLGYVGELAEAHHD